MKRSVDATSCDYINTILLPKAVCAKQTAPEHEAGDGGLELLRSHNKKLWLSFRIRLLCNKIGFKARPLFLSSTGMLFLQLISVTATTKLSIHSQKKCNTRTAWSLAFRHVVIRHSPSLYCGKRC